MEPVWPGWRTGCGPCRGNNRSGPLWAIELPRGAIVEGLVERGFHVFAINPQATGPVPGIVTVSRAKDDRAILCPGRFHPYRSAQFFVGSNSMTRSSYD